MTAAAARARLPDSLATTYLVGGGLAVAVGVGVAVDLRLGVALAFATLTVPLALVDLPAVIALWAALTVFSRQPGFGLAISATGFVAVCGWLAQVRAKTGGRDRSEEHTSELQSLRHLVCRLLLEKKKTKTTLITINQIL